MSSPSQNILSKNKETNVLIGSVFIAGLCSIIYELLIGSTSSYFLGDSVKQFSLTIGFYMAAMGFGSYISRHIKDEHLLISFVSIEILLGLFGGISVPMLYFVFAYTDLYTFAMISMTLLIGVFIGLEIPLLSRVLQRYYSLRLNLSNVLSVDYIGALVATLVFPFLLLPFLGTFRSSLAFGLVNMLIGFLILWCFSSEFQINKKRLLFKWNLFVVILLGSILATSNLLLSKWTSDLYQDRVVLSEETQYQKVVITKEKEDVRLYLNGNLQMSSIDEYRYHESLTHIAMNNAKRQRILILGGGDGVVIRELLKYDDIESIHLVDLDPEMIRIAKTNYHLSKINQNSLSNSKVSIYYQDALSFLNKENNTYDIIIGDLPDPNNTSLSRLYSKEFFLILRKRLTPNGVFVTQATSPFYAKKAFWCINKTIASAGFLHVLPYHINVPSFGEWGFVIASNKAIKTEQLKFDIKTRYLDNTMINRMFVFEKDLLDNNVNINTLDKPVLLSYYLDSWKYWN